MSSRLPIFRLWITERGVRRAVAQCQIMPRAVPSTYALDPAMPVLLRPDGAVQVGWDPRRAVLVRPPGGLTAAELATLLRSMRSPVPLGELQRHAADRGLVEACGTPTGWRAWSPNW